MESKRLVSGDLAVAATSSNSFSPRASVSENRLLLVAQNARDLLSRLPELRIGLAHLLDDDVGQAREKRRLEPDSPAPGERRGG